MNHFYNWNNVFRNPEVIKTAVPVRYDPFDLSTAFALVQGQWVTCRAPYLSLEGHTEKELLIATTELRRQARCDGVPMVWSCWGHLYQLSNDRKLSCRESGVIYHVDRV